MDAQTTELELGDGTPRDREAYESYCRYCALVDVSPAPFVRWLKLSANGFKAESAMWFPAQ